MWDTPEERCVVGRGVRSAVGVGKREAGARWKSQGGELNSRSHILREFIPV